MDLSSASCNQCTGHYTVTRLVCQECGTAVEGRFSLPRLARLPAEDRRFIEVFLLAEGNIKETGRVLGVSYPAVRNRLDKMTSALRREIERDSKHESQVTRKEK
jgi:hypothetical protein